MAPEGVKTVVEVSQATRVTIRAALARRLKASKDGE